ncbi:MAG TPA: TonB-dependent receptor [Ignavibacteriaceae bacterium]|nr:TonB-dependent receptor [Ignavibacteriaceae bacterium]
MYLKKILLPLAILILFFPILSVAQQRDSSKIFRMSEIVVTATRTKIPAIEAASSITVIDSTEIAALNKRSVFGLLKDQYGVSFTQQGAPGSLSYVYLRGADPGQTLVLLDGIALNMTNDPDNTYDFANLPVENIERIEILRGPQSTLYGSNALGGVINIITKEGSGKPKFFLSAEGGSYNSYNADAGFDGSLDKFNYSLTYSRFKSDGFSSASSKYGNTEKDGTSNYNISSRFGETFSSNFNLNFFAHFTKAQTALDQHGGFEGDDPTFVYNIEEQSYRTEGRISLFNGLWDQILGVSFIRNVRKYNFDSTLFNPASSNSFYDGNKIKFDWQNNLKLSNNLISLGVDEEKEIAISDYFYNSSVYGNFNSIFPQNSATTFGIYIQDQLNEGKSFFSSFGVRYDKHSRFGSVITYRIAPAYVFWNTGTKLKATFGTGFKAPSLFYLFDPAYGNINLKPEKSTGWDVGVEQFLFQDKLDAGLNYFDNSFTDLFGFDNNFRTINVDKAETKGVEFYVSSKLTENIDLKFNYTYTDAKDLSNNSPDKNLPLLRRPKNKLGFNADYNFLDKVNANIEIIYVGERDDKDFNQYPVPRVKLPDYTLVNLSASYNFTKVLQFYGRIDNLFNKYYEDVLGYATPGQSEYLGIKLNF